MYAVGENRELACFGTAKRAVDSNQVAEVEALDQFPIFGTNLILANEQLNSAGPILDVDKLELAFVAVQDNSPRSPHAGALHFSRSLSSQPRAEFETGLAQTVRKFDGLAIFADEADFVGSPADITNQLTIIKPLSPGIVSELNDLFQLIAAGLMQGIDVFGRDLRCFAHALR
jgi:hypothetical protein